MFLIKIEVEVFRQIDVPRLGFRAVGYATHTLRANSLPNVRIFIQRASRHRLKPSRCYLLGFIVLLLYRLIITIKMGSQQHKLFHLFFKLNNFQL
jgi:Trk-type K+ transport system membrane component